MPSDPNGWGKRLGIASLGLLLLPLTLSSEKDPFYGVSDELYWSSPRPMWDKFTELDDFVELMRAFDELGAGTLRITIVPRALYPFRDGEFHDRFFRRPDQPLVYPVSDGSPWIVSEVGLSRLDRVLALIPEDVDIVVRLDLLPSWFRDYEPQIDGTYLPRPPGSDWRETFRRNWSKHLRFLAERYQGRLRTWQVWNEPDFFANGDAMGTGYAVDLAANYVDLVLNPGVAALREADPTATIVTAGIASHGGSIGRANLIASNFLEDLLVSADQDGFDAIAFHPYIYFGDDDRDGLQMGPFVLTYGGSVSGGPKPSWVLGVGSSIPGASLVGNEGWTQLDLPWVSWNDFAADDFPPDYLFLPEVGPAVSILDRGLTEPKPVWFTEFGELLSGVCDPAVASRWDLHRIFEEANRGGYRHHPQYPLDRVIWWSLRDLPFMEEVGPEGECSAFYPTFATIANWSAPTGLIHGSMAGATTKGDEGGLITVTEPNGRRASFYVLRDLIRSRYQGIPVDAGYFGPDDRVYEEIPGPTVFPSADIAEAWGRMDASENPAPVLPRSFLDDFESLYWTRGESRFLYDPIYWQAHPGTRVAQEDGYLILSGNGSLAEPTTATWNRLLQVNTSQGEQPELEAWLRMPEEGEARIRITPGFAASARSLQGLTIILESTLNGIIVSTLATGSPVTPGSFPFGGEPDPIPAGQRTSQANEPIGPSAGDTGFVHIRLGLEEAGLVLRIALPEGANFAKSIPPFLDLGRFPAGLQLSYAGPEDQVLRIETIYFRTGGGLSDS